MKTPLPPSPQLARLARAAVLVCAAWCAAPTNASAQAETGDFFTTFFGNPERLANRPAGYIFCPWNRPSFIRAADLNAEAAAGRKTSIWLRGQPGDVPLEPLLSEISKLDYALADFEGPYGPGSEHEAAVHWMVDSVRGAPGADVRNAFIGNYSEYPGAYEESIIWHWLRNRTEADPFYRTSGLNVAQPSAYPYAAYIYHNMASAQGHDNGDSTNVTPNARSSYFWTPLERVSTVARALPAGHKLIPYITDFWDAHGDGNFYLVPPGQFPTAADNTASVQHYRLRGASGFHIWGASATRNPLPQQQHQPPPAVPYYVTWQNYTDYLDYLNQMRTAWTGLDADFAGTKVKSVLNLATDKRGGLEWSGVRNGNSIKLLLSNLSGASKVANIQTNANANTPKTWFRGMPATVAVGEGVHLSQSYTISNLLSDGAMTTAPSTYWYPWNSAATFSSTGGSGAAPGSSCYHLAGATTVAGQENLRVEPGAVMNVSVWAKASTATGAKFHVNFYLRNSAGAIITTSGASTFSTFIRAFPNGVVPTTTAQTFTTATMTIPTTAGSPAQVPYYISALVQNVNAPTVTVDDLVVKFAYNTISDLLSDGAMTTAPSTYWYPWSSAATFSSTGGSGTAPGSSCYSLEGPATVQGREFLRVQPGAVVPVSVWAKASTATGAKFHVNFYLRNSAGAGITTSGASTIVRAFPNGVVPTTTAQTFTANVAIPTTAGSPAQVPYYIDALIQNVNAPTVTVDDLVVSP